jgi:hypothetical protein
MSAQPVSTPSSRRIRRGRHFEYEVDGAYARGVTTCIDGIDKPALRYWYADQTAGYAVDHWDELAALGVSERLRILSRAATATRNTKAVRGTDVHALAVRLAAGEEVDVPEHLTGHVDAYLRFVEDWRPVELMVEQAVIKRQPWPNGNYGGTFDLLAELCDAQTWLLDYKTSKHVHAENALQLAAYRYADAYLDEHGAEQPMPPVDACGIVHLRADGYDLVPMAADEAAFAVFQYAQQITAFLNDTKDDRHLFVGEAIRP